MSKGELFKPQDEYVPEQVRMHEAELFGLFMDRLRGVPFGEACKEVSFTPYAVRDWGHRYPEWYGRIMDRAIEQADAYVAERKGELAALRTQVQLETEEKLLREATSVLEATIKEAKAGDVGAQRLVWKYLTEGFAERHVPSPASLGPRAATVVELPTLPYDPHKPIDPSTVTVGGTKITLTVETEEEMVDITPE